MTPADAIEEVVGPGQRPAAPATAATSRRDFLVLAGLYALAQAALFLVPNAVFWDDWTLYRTPAATIAEMFTDVGAVAPVTWLHHALMAAGMWSYKFLTFGLWFGTGLLLDRILARTRLLPDGARFAVVLLFLVLPVNAARIAAINFPYTLCVFLFFLAWWLMDRRRVAALLLFAASFVTPSLLVFYALPFADMAWRGGHLASLGSALRFALRRLDFLLLPFAFFAARIATFTPGGTYAGYNSQYKWSHVRPALDAQWLDTRALPGQVDPLLLLLLLPLVGWLIARRAPALSADGRPGRGRALGWLALGAGAFVLGGFAYWILGLVPTFNEWSSRHQLLLPLGMAVMLVALVWLLPLRLRTAALSLVTAACLSLGLANAYMFWIDHQKQRTLLGLIAADSNIRDASLVVFVDRTPRLNAIRRQYRFYEWNGLMEEAFGDEKRFGTDPAGARAYLAGEYDVFLKGQYRAAGHRRDPAAAVVLAEITAAPLAAGRIHKIWHWPPVPALTLKTTRVAPSAIQQLQEQ